MADNPNITINITGANPQIYPSAEQITHNHYYGDKFAEDAIKANKKEILLNQEAKEEKEEEKDELALLLRDEELYKDVVYWASTCKKAKDIRERIVEPLRRKGHKYFDKNFVKSLLPFLINYEGSKNLDTLMKQIY